MHALQEQKAQDRCADCELKRWTCEEKVHSAREEREHDIHHLQLEEKLKAQRYEHEWAISHDEVQKLQLQVKLQRLKIQEAAMQKGHSGEGPES